jgi:hypothetical protein
MRAWPWSVSGVLALLLVLVSARWATLEFWDDPVGNTGRPTTAPPSGASASAGEGGSPVTQTWAFNPWSANTDVSGAADGAPDNSAAWLHDEEVDLPPEILERARKQFAREADGRRAERRAAIRDEVDAFIEEERLDEDKAEALSAIFDRMEATMTSLREAAQAGDGDMRATMQKMREAREDTRAEAVALLGEEAADRLRDRIREVAGPPGGGPGFGGPFGGPGFGGPFGGGPLGLPVGAP